MKNGAGGSCTACAAHLNSPDANTYYTVSAPGATECVQCEPGSLTMTARVMYHMITLTHRSLSCPFIMSAGKFKTATSGAPASCTDCLAGSFSNLVATNAGVGQPATTFYCRECALAYFAEGEGKSICTQCAPVSIPTLRAASDS